MKTKRLLAKNEPLIPELDVPPDALLGGPEVLDEDDAADATARLLEWRVFSAPEVSIFNLPLFCQLRQRPYHQVAVPGPFDIQRLAHDHRDHIFRSEVVCFRRSKPSVASLLLCLGQGVFVLQEDSRLIVIAPTPQAAAKVAADFRQYVKPSAKAKPGFYLVSFGERGPHAELIEVATCPAGDADQLALHYGADFPTWEKQWLEQLAKRRSGVTILFGPPGAGKTTYLRMLMARFNKRFVFYYLPLSSFELLSDPQFVNFWMRENREHKGKAKLAIIEDAENLLLPRDERSRAQVSNLLNIGDGFLGEHLKLHVVATTNAPMRKMDEAVLRPGRLTGTREFRRLTRAEAMRLAQAKGLTLADRSDTWSLAEIYNGQPEVLAPQPNVGFSRSE